MLQKVFFVLLVYLKRNKMQTREATKQDIEEYIDEILLASYPDLTVTDIAEIDWDEKRIMIGWD